MPTAAVQVDVAAQGNKRCTAFCHSFIVPTAAGQDGGGGPAGLGQGCCTQNIPFGFLTASGVIEFSCSLQQRVICGF